MGLTSFDVSTLTRYFASRVDLHVRWITTIRANVTKVTEAAKEKVAHAAAAFRQPAPVPVAA